MQKLTEMLTSSITSDLPPRSEDPHDHTTHETIRRENLAAATSEANASKNAARAQAPRNGPGGISLLVRLQGLHGYLKVSYGS